MPVTSAAVSNLIEEIRLARTESDRFFEIIKEGALYERPIDARHRVIFYVGHLDGFDSIQICREGLGVRSFDPQFDELFQAGIDPDSSHLPSDQPSDWPALERVRDYVRQSRDHVDRYLEHAPEEVVYMALEHRLMHLETLAYMFHNFPYARKNHPPSGWEFTGSESVTNEWRSIPAGVATLGIARNSIFAWDNEYDQTRFDVPGFAIQRFSVTNGEYLQFVAETGASLPHFWVKRGNDLFLRGMFDEVPLPLSWPVYVTQAEAAAYAKAQGKALPTEQQFHRAAYATPEGRTRQYPWGDQPPSQQGNFDFRRWDPAPVNSDPAGDSAFGVSQLVGNGWEWTSTPFGPLPGFAPRPSYPGYSANFFDGQHFVLKGGSSRTAARLLRPSFRNWFRHDYPFVYAKFRCVSN